MQASRLNRGINRCLRAASSNLLRQNSSTNTLLTRNYIVYNPTSAVDADAALAQFTRNESVAQWIKDRSRLQQPARIHLCDGSQEEYDMLVRRMVHGGTLVQLNPKLRPNSYLARSPATDVARVEEKTFICTESKDDAGFTNNWRDPEETTTMMDKLFQGSMAGRTMYVVPYCMGPIGSPFSIIGIQMTDSPYVAASMRIMTRMGQQALDALGDNGEFVPCVHSVGMPSGPGKEDVPWPENPNEKYIIHFPEQRRIWSYGSGYGGNALLGKKCLSLRIGSYIARDEGWLAEHMLIVGITNPQGQKKYVAAAFPSACGKTNLAMMNPKLPGWKVETVGDDIAWIRVGPDGRLYAVNPEYGFFGVAPGTSYKSNPNAMDMLKENVLFTNVAMTDEGDVWWEDMTDQKPPHLVSWTRNDWYPEHMANAAHSNSRFTVPVKQCKVLDPEWENPNGVPLSAIIFGGRRSNVVPLVYQARNWRHGTFIGANMNSETTAAAAGKRGVLRADPFAMKPFCGYNMGAYFNHWLSFAKRTNPAHLPKIFHVNWFRKNAANKFLWPGFGENARVIKWIFERCDQDVADYSNADETPIGLVPKPGALDINGLNISSTHMHELSSIDAHEWRAEVSRARGYFNNFGNQFPKALSDELDALGTRLDNWNRES